MPHEVADDTDRERIVIVNRALADGSRGNGDSHLPRKVSEATIGIRRDQYSTPDDQKSHDKHTRHNQWSNQRTSIREK